MQAIQQLEARLSQININKMIDELFGTSKYQRMLPDMVKHRLAITGLYSTGKVIETYKSQIESGGAVYAINTIKGTHQYRGKIDKGQPYGQVRLKDTGAFYETFNLQPKQTFAVIEYDENKPDGRISDNVDLDNIFNLSEGEMKELQLNIIPDIINLIKLKLSA